jgi:hypothetical protein
VPALLLVQTDEGHRVIERGWQGFSEIAIVGAFDMDARQEAIAACLVVPGLSGQAFLPPFELGEQIVLLLLGQRRAARRLLPLIDKAGENRL